MAITGTATLSAAIGKIVLGLAVSALSRRSRGSTATAGIKTEVSTVGGTTPQSFILGRYATSGNHISPAMSTQYISHMPNGWLVYVVDISDMPVANLNRLIVDGEYVTLDETPGADGYLNATGRLAGHMDIRFYDGTQTTADQWLIDTFGTYPERPWLSDMVGVGVAYAVLRFSYNRELYSGLPQVKFEIEGIPLYDPRKDGSLSGGAGAHRWNDQSTWETTRNPAVMIYNILRGIPLFSGNLYGLNAGSDEVSLSHAVAAMNICDTPRDGETGAQYLAGYEVKMGAQSDGGEDPLTVIDELLKAMDGDVAEVGGAWYMRAGGPGLPVMTITDEDIARNRPQDLDPFPGLGESVNALKASSPSPASLWEAKDAPTRYDDQAIIDDGQELMTEILLPTVFRAAQVQQLMKSWLSDARRFRKHNIQLMPHAINLVPLDVIVWNSDRNNYVGKEFEVDQTGISTTDFAVSVAIREVDPAAGRWLASDLQDVSEPASVVVQPPEEALPGFTVTAVAILDENSVARIPAILITWEGDIPDVTAVTYVIREKVTGENVARGSTSNIEDGEELISGGILPEMVYQVKANMKAKRKTIWTQWTDVTTPAVVGPDAEVPANVLQDIQDAQDAADAAALEAANALADAQGAQTDASQALADTLANAGLIDGIEVEIDTLSLETGDNATGITEIKALDTGAMTGTALAALLNQLQTDAFGSSATVTSLLQTQVDVDGFAIAYAGLTVETSGGNISGFKATSWSDPDGSGGGVLELLGDVIVEKSLSANRLTIGIGKNLLDNADLTQGLVSLSPITGGAIGADSELTLRSDSDDYGTDFYPTIRLRTYVASVTNDGGIGVNFLPFENDGTAGFGYPVKPGVSYEFSAGIVQRRCEVAIYIVWYDMNGALLTTSTVNQRSITGVDGSGTGPSSWERYGGSIVAPSSAAYAMPSVRINGTTVSSGIRDAHVFQPMFCATEAGAALSPYSPGSSTFIDGGRIVTESLFADKIASDQITTRHVDVQNGITTDRLRVNSILNMNGEGAGFKFGKRSLADYTRDGLFAGMTEVDGAVKFGAFLGIHSGDDEQFVRLTEADGLEIKNATFWIGTGTSTSEYVTSTKTVSISSNTSTVSIAMVGSGGGGGGGAASGVSGSAGTSGGACQVQVRDGTTVYATYEVTGGVGGGGGTSSGIGSPNAASVTSAMSPDGDGGFGGYGYSERRLRRIRRRRRAGRQ